jgi:asparagine synthase (glutamine-hydrolysing)
MCGIIAITGNTTKNVTDAQLGAMLSSLSRRGPDDKGFLRLGNSILGQTRLSIVDIDTGHQPMKDNKNQYTIVFNGEIYGYRELRKKLEECGHVFSTKSDTEVILKSYAEYGERCVEHLDGMFAFAIWNELKQELFVARDRFGKKPFYYAWVEGTFLGASEIKAIFESGLLKGRVDLKSLDNYLQLGYIPPWKTIYSNIQTIPPAHAGIVENGKLDLWKYWELKNKPLKISYEDAKKEIRSLFDKAVQKRMVADVEIGSLLSGGVDSTIVTAYAQKYCAQPIKTFSIGYGK